MSQQQIVDNDSSQMYIVMREMRESLISISDTSEGTRSSIIMFGFGLKEIGLVLRNIKDVLVVGFKQLITTLVNPKGGKTKGMLAKVGKALTGFSSGLKASNDKFRKSMKLLGKDVDESGNVVDGGDDMSGGLEDAQKGLKKFMKGMKKSFGSIFKSVMGPAALLMDFMGGFMEPFEMIIEPLTMFGEILGTLLYPILEPIANMMYAMMPYLEKLVEWLSPILSFLFKIISPIGIIADKGETLRKLFVNIGNALKNAGTSIKTFFSKLGSSIVTAIKNGWNAVIDWFKGIWTSLLTAIKNGWNAVIDWFKSIPQMILDALINAFDFVGGIGDAISNWWQRLWD